MHGTSERLFFAGLAILILALAAVDSGLGGAERPYLIFILVGGVMLLWFLTRQYSRVPERWRRRGNGAHADASDQDQ